MTASRTQEAHGYEFGGPLGAIGITIGLPTVVYCLISFCNDVSGCPANLRFDHDTIFETLSEATGWQGWHFLFNWPTFATVLGYYTLGLVLFGVLPATETWGSELRTGGRIKYRFNAFYTLLAMLGILATGTWNEGADFVVWTFITDNYLAIATSNLIIAFLLATYSYTNSFSTPSRAEKSSGSPPRELALGGNSGHILYDWFIGRELNPHIWLPGLGYVDFKTYMETRPGLIGWIIIDLAFAAKQYRDYHTVTNSMVIVILAQSVYVVDALLLEPLILGQIDITTDGFGFMLAFGDVVWLPFTFSLQAKYLSVCPVQLSRLAVGAIFAIYVVGYYIFRSSNSQKDTFRTHPDDPSVKDLSFIQTSSGRRLLTGGWWGTARHINYLGDWILSWAYCLPTALAGYTIKNDPTSGATTAYQTVDGRRKVVTGDAEGWGMIFTFFYVLYFAVLLIHRQRRDDFKCARKYGADWEEYVRRVPSRIVPGVY